MAQRMHPLVKELMTRIILLKQDHYDPEYLMSSARREFSKNAHLTEEKDILKAVAYGRYLVRQEQAFIRFKTYRLLQKNYNPEFQAGKSFDRSTLKDFKAEGYNEATELRKVIDRIDE